MFSHKNLAAAVLGGAVLIGAGMSAAYADHGSTESAAQEFSIGPAAVREIGETGTVLFPVFAAARDDQGAQDQPDFFAYCIEMGVRARFDVDVELAEWSQFQGKNDFTGNPKVQEKVGWIIKNSYPTVDLVDLGERAGVNGLTAAEAIAGTQHAIWHFTDGERRKLRPHAAALRDYLTGEANVGLPERDVRPTVRVEVRKGANRELGKPIGPFVVESNVEPIVVTTDSEAHLIDEAGEPLDAGNVGSGTEIFLNVPDGAGPGTADILAQVDAAQASGSILKVPSASPKYTHAQTLILVTAGTATAASSREISWKTLPNLPTVVEPAPPAIEQQECAGPGDSPGVDLRPAATAGIDYEYSRAEVLPGAIVVVTAVPHEGFELAPAPAWEIHADGSAATEIRLPEPHCSADESPPPPKTPPAEEPAEPEALSPSPGDGQELPDTGTPSLGLIALSAAFGIGGIAAVIVAWHNRPS